jgi:glycosyltransferase involved in cell wall biosynthesis
LNIVFFAEQSPYLRNRVGGAENSIRLIAEGLAARGHTVTLASLRPDPLPWPRRFTAGVVSVLLCPSPRRTLRYRTLRRLRRGNGRLARALDARAWTRVARTVFDGRKIDLLYAFYEMEFLEQALAARDAAPEPPVLVMRMAGLNWYETIRRGAPPAPYARVFNAVDAINYLSESGRDLTQARAAEVGLDLAPRGDFIADIGVNLAAAPGGWQGPSAGGGLDLVVATRFSPHQKRQDLLVEALGRLKDRLDFRLTMIGTGATREPIAARVAALGLGDRVRIVPFMAQEDLWRVLAQADLLCHPCDHEGVSKIILEAMMLGLPVLASDVPPLPDYVIEGETGMRVANTPEAWADRLLAIAAAKDRLPALSERARGFIAAHYDMRANIARYEAVFARLVAGEAPAQAPELSSPASQTRSGASLQ